MNGDAVALLVLWACCISLMVVQAAGWPRTYLVSFSIAVACGMYALGEAASYTSVAKVLQWASDAHRRQDLSALVLVEAVLFGTRALHLAQGDTRSGWRCLDYMPMPSFALALFGGQVMLMLSVDGLDFDFVALLGGVVVALAVSCAASGVRASIDSSMRSVLRVGLHGIVATSAIWLARGPASAAVDPTPLQTDRLMVVVAAVTGLVLVGALWQRQGWERFMRTASRFATRKKRWKA
jgi:hypothetical protein